MDLWLSQLRDPVPDGLKTPAEVARFELEHALPDLAVTLDEDVSMGDGYRIEASADGGMHITGGKTGLLYGAYRMILDRICGEALSFPAESSPKYALRMINCWDNPDGTIERGYAGQSLFFAGGKLSWNPVRIRELGRLMASAGLNVLCINNVNVHFPAQLLLEEDLPSLALLADTFRPFGIRLMLSIDFSQPMRSGIPTADPMAPAVREWWKKTAARVWTAIPDLAGFLVKADSEGRPGPFSYGRNHADGANMLAEAVEPFAVRR